MGKEPDSPPWSQRNTLPSERNLAHGSYAFDGSRGSAPRTTTNEAASCAANYGKGMTAKYRKKKSKGLRRRRNEKDKAHAQEPQAWIAMMWHMGLRPPWHWRLGPANSSERAHVMEMVPTGQYPQRTLFCGDAGFVGYPLWAVSAWDSTGRFWPWLWRNRSR
jgi:hypothetical protein